jgi:hypothetical protein
MTNATKFALIAGPQSIVAAGWGAGHGYVIAGYLADADRVHPGVQHYVRKQEH